MRHPKTKVQFQDETTREQGKCNNKQKGFSIVAVRVYLITIDLS